MTLRLKIMYFYSLFLEIMSHFGRNLPFLFLFLVKGKKEGAFWFLLKTIKFFKSSYGCRFFRRKFVINWCAILAGKMTIIW